jgi:8-oxo-dGTP pyrophosphatase MutT (NUDIX family)
MRVAALRLSRRKDLKHRDAACERDPRDGPMAKNSRSKGKKSKGRNPGRAKAVKLVTERRGKVLLVRRRIDGLWMFPGGRKRGKENDRACMRREIREELPKLKVGRLRLWKELNGRNKRSGRRMSDAVFLAGKVSGKLVVGDRKELTGAEWKKPHGRMRLTATSRHIRDRLFPKRRRK